MGRRGLGALLLELQHTPEVLFCEAVIGAGELRAPKRGLGFSELTELEGDNAGQLAVRLTEVANLRGGL